MTTRDERLEQVVVRCREGEQAAFSELFRLIRTDILRIVVSTVGPDAELEDIVQTASLEVFRSIRRFKGQSKFSSWLYRLVVNVALQHLRRRKTVPRPIDVGGLADVLVAADEDPESVSVHRERLRSIREIIQEIAPKKRAVFLMHEVDGFTPEEIADKLGVSRLTIKSRLFYARKDFQRKLRQQAMLMASREKTAKLSESDEEV